MAKKAAVLVVDPVNGAGLFHYLEAFFENADKPFNREMLRIMKRFAEQGKPMIGHCAAALLYDNLGIARGRRVALHPFLKTVVRECIPTDDKAVVDGNFYTAQTENTLSELMPRVLQALK